MAVQTKPWHRDDLARLPNDGNRYEVLDGLLLVTPQASSPHQQVALGFAVALLGYVNPLGTMRVATPGCVLLGRDEQLQPDVQVYPAPPSTRNWAELPPPILVVEVLSRSNQRHDFGIKRAAYLERVGVPVVWLADWHRREVHVCRLGEENRVEREVLEWQAPGAAAPLRIDVQKLFTAAIGPE